MTPKLKLDPPDDSPAVLPATPFHALPMQVRLAYYGVATP